MKLQVALIAAASVVSMAGAAFAQVEAQCPPGWQGLPTPPGAEGQRTLAVCSRDQMQLMAVEVSHTIGPNDPAEAAISQQFASRMSESGNGTVAPFRAETVRGQSVRTTEISGSTSLPDGTTTQVHGLVMFVPATEGTVIVVGMSHDPHADVRPFEHTFVGSMAGLTGAPPAWRASGTCPTGLHPAPTESSSGMRHVLRCESEAGMQIEVLESRLPVRTPEEARVPALQRQRGLQARLQMIGGTVTIDATRAVTFGTTPGFVTQIHASASDPRAAPGTSSAGIHLEMVEVMIPTSIGGHVQIDAISQAADANTLLETMRTFVTQNLRLDGSGVVAEAPGAAGGDSGAESAPAPPRHHEIDPDMPLWSPPAEAPPHATDHPDEHKSGCGCSTPGALPTPWASVALAWVALAVMRRRRVIAPEARR